LRIKEQETRLTLQEHDNDDDDDDNDEQSSSYYTVADLYMDDAYRGPQQYSNVT